MSGRCFQRLLLGRPIVTLNVRKLVACSHFDWAWRNAHSPSLAVRNPTVPCGLKVDLRISVFDPAKHHAAVRYPKDHPFLTQTTPLSGRGQASNPRPCGPCCFASLRCPHHPFERGFPRYARCNPAPLRTFRGSVKGIVPWTTHRAWKGTTS